MYAAEQEHPERPRCLGKRAAQRPGSAVVPERTWRLLSAHGVHYLLAKHVATATSTCPSLKRKRVSPHVLRHTTAMDLLQHGVEQSVIALWLGHESIETTQVYLDADLELKRRSSTHTPPTASRDAIDPTTSSWRSSRACSGGAICPVLHRRHRRQAVGPRT